MKAILEYEDIHSDRKYVFRILSRDDVRIIKTREKSFKQQIIIWVKDINTLNDIIWDLNTGTTYGVKLVKKKLENTFCERLKEFVSANKRVEK